MLALSLTMNEICSGPMFMQQRMAPAGEPDTARQACRTQSTLIRSDHSRGAFSNHATGTEMSARTAHNCAANVESSSRVTSVAARGRQAAADCRVYCPLSSLPVITPTSTGGGKPPSSSGSLAGRWERPLAADPRGSCEEPAPTGASLQA
eukprot:1759129-Rhodomonas_salina.2